MTNVNLLKAKIVECGYIQSDIAKMLNISASSLNDKLCGRRGFKQDEIENLSRILKIEKEVNKYFFAQ